MTTKSEIESLLFLMDDPDPFVQESVENRLHQLGEKAVPILDQYRAETSNKNERKRVNEVIHKLTFDALESDFIEVMEGGLKTRKSLETAILTLSRFGNPTLRISDYQHKLDHFAQVVEPQIKYKLDERKKMKKFLAFIFEDLNFRGDASNYHAPENCYLSNVIDRRKGLPISLSLVVMFIARRLELPFFGINMPIHFMLNFVGDKEELLIDPYDNGEVVTYDQCYFFLKKNNIEPRPEHFRIATNLDIVLRCLRNLIHSYERLEEPGRMESLKNLLNIAEMYQD
ncbi:transglutaminase-like domain-containing protein [Gracilimonas mengyeensis]|uniref:Transglutaminase-like superfamily protein n=1 Tax=Gracilimonas mengyeensis TaxID=1302730 RepID=A0A521BUB7_9BACT|nr:transglutaminase-like domain-containing protein [Gracilimonas mengyeensis]SMO50743.1 Transglutaminase-like superfamily protein [Gracilimonas mengyeensis]